MPRTVTLALALITLTVVVNSRNIVVHNNCPFTVWPGLFTAPGGPIPNHPTGWVAPPGSSNTVTVPENWRAGRIWGRTGCNFNNGLPGPLQCQTGGCNGGLLCDPASGTGVPPASLAEWTFTDQDYYDISIVDGSNLPIRLTAANCPTGECRFDFNTNCPPALQQRNSAGAVVGCKSACFANLDGNRNDSPNCCTGSHRFNATCPSSGVWYYDYFHGNCPNAYTYAYDDRNGLKTCGARTDYTLTFCP
ncbi:Osmotin, thaumatin-like protein [Auricularia subglabra TFB-10046 SS5]|nr:Osmotin, thaumatin-like protein [Auricularia subglabra TFB-10046 SS5]